MTSPEVHILIVSATDADTRLVHELADEYRAAMILDSRCDHRDGMTRLEQSLGSCYARLPDDLRVSSLLVGKIAGIVRSWRNRTCILVLVNADQVEPFSAAVHAACPPGVKVKVARKGSGTPDSDIDPGESQRPVQGFSKECSGAPQPH